MQSAGLTATEKEALIATWMGREVLAMVSSETKMRWLTPTRVEVDDMGKVTLFSHFGDETIIQSADALSHANVCGSRDTPDSMTPSSLGFTICCS